MKPIVVLLPQDLSAQVEALQLKILEYSAQLASIQIQTKLSALLNVVMASKQAQKAETIVTVLVETAVLQAVQLKTDTNAMEVAYIQQILEQSVPKDSIQTSQIQLNVSQSEVMVSELEVRNAMMEI